MSHLVTSRGANLCAADGCPLLGAITGSTQGDHRWLCHLHHGQPPSRWPRISACLDEQHWLAGNMVALRRARWSEDFRQSVYAARRAFAEQGRTDLHNTRGESFDGWMRRLDAALTAAVLARLDQSRKTQNGKGAWSRASFDLPGIEEASEEEAA